MPPGGVVDRRATPDRAPRDAKPEELVGHVYRGERNLLAKSAILKRTPRSGPLTR